MATRKLTEQNTKRIGTPAFVGGLIVAGFVVIGGAVFIGKSDDGQINVSATIQNSNQANIEAGNDINDNVGVVPEAFRNKPNGDLVSQQNQGAGTPPPEVVPDESPDTTTATTADTPPEDGTVDTTDDSPATQTEGQ